MLTLGRELQPTTLEPTGALATLDPRELTRHSFCVGMTGSGKTGMCVGLLEGLALLGVPILVIDPKGDLANLALVLDPDRPEEFLPWVDPGEADRQGVPLDELAARTAARWGQGQAAEGIGPAERAATRDRVEVIVHTPGSEAGVPVDILTGLTRAPDGLAQDPEGLREYVAGAVAALLSLVGLEVDPLVDPRAILLCRILGDAFANGEDVPLDVLLPRVVDPPFDALGYFAVDDVLPRADRTALTLALNNVAASPSFRAWLTGVPLDIAAWLAPTQAGKTPIRVLSLAHLDDRQRQFFVTLVLHAVVAWSRRLPGTGNLRALVYFDEVSGYLPPHPKDPPTKAPVLTLMKQARAVGVGVVLCTQNPVDIDYKAMSNAGTWFVGRLQTKQDRQRLLDGLVAAVGADAELVDDLLGRLPKRSFVWRTAEHPSARVLRTRHVTCFLRGPLTRREIALLGQTWERSAAVSDGLLGEAPPLGPEVPVRWLSPEGCAALGIESGATWSPTLYVRYRVTFDDPGVHEERIVHRWRRGGEDLATELQDPWLVRAEPSPGRYRVVPSELVSAPIRKRWAEALQATEEVPGPVGPVRPDPGDVVVVGWAVVWVPEAG